MEDFHRHRHNILHAPFALGDDLNAEDKELWKLDPGWH
jgi:hypothetical protein